MTTIPEHPDGSPNWEELDFYDECATADTVVRMMRSAYIAALKRCAKFASEFQPTLERPEHWKEHLHAMRCSEAGMRGAISDEIHRWIEEEKSK